MPSLRESLVWVGSLLTGYNVRSPEGTNPYPGATDLTVGLIIDDADDGGVARERHITTVSVTGRLVNQQNEEQVAELADAIIGLLRDANSDGYLVLRPFTTTFKSAGEVVEVDIRFRVQWDILL